MSELNQHAATKKKIKIIVADDHTAVRKSFVQLLNESGHYKVVGEASNGRELLELLPEVSPDVVLLDVDMPQMNGKETLQRITKTYPAIKPIMLSGHFGHSYVREFVSLGARAYLPKSCDIEELLETIHQVHEKGYAKRSGIRPLNIWAEPRESIAFSLEQVALTDKEVQVLKLICEGHSSKLMAASLNIDINTVTFHKRNIYRKTGLTSTAALVKYAIRNNYTDL